MGSKNKNDEHGSYDKYSGEVATILLLLDLEQKMINLRIQQEALIAALESKQFLVAHDSPAQLLTNGDVESKKGSIKSKYNGALNEIERQKKVVSKNKNCEKELKTFVSSESAMMKNEKSFLKECFDRLFD